MVTVRRAAAVAAFALATLTAVPAAEADWLYVTKQGLAHLDEIRKAIAPAPLMQAAKNPFIPQHPDAATTTTWFVRVILRGVKGPQLVDRPAGLVTPRAELINRIKRGEGIGTGVHPDTILTVVALGPGVGGPRSDEVQLPLRWFIVLPEVDSLRDVRFTFGNYDEAYATSTVNRGYASRVLEAIDPDGKMGLRPSGLPAIAPRVPVEHGFSIDQIQRLKMPPASRPDEYDSRADFIWARTSRNGLVESLHRVDEEMGPWIRAIAMARRYDNDPGFAASASGAVGSLLALATLEPGDLTRFALRMLESLIFETGAVPGEAHPWDGPDVQAAEDWASEQVDHVLDVADAATLARVRAGYLQRAPPGRKPFFAGPFEWGVDEMFPIDPSEMAAIALEFLIQAEGLCVVDDSAIGNLVRNALASARQVGVFPDPRAADRIRLRPIAQRLLIRMLTPSTSRDPRIKAACDRMASQTRDIVVDTLLNGVYRPNSGERLFALDILRLTGWASQEQMENIAFSLPGSATSFVFLRDEPDRAEPTLDAAARRLRLAQLEAYTETSIRIASAVLDLAKDKEQRVRAGAVALRAWIDQVRPDSSGGDKYFVDRLNALRKGG